jgi:hypothetical protein
MQSAYEYGVFEDCGKGPLWREFFRDLDKAKVRAKRLADESDHECFVFCFKNYIEVARSSPSKIKPKPNPIPVHPFS